MPTQKDGFAKELMLRLLTFTNFLSSHSCFRQEPNRLVMQTLQATSRGLTDFVTHTLRGAKNGFLSTRSYELWRLSTAKAPLLVLGRN